jgi:NAD(P)-dependent dehydrogenase (short-subunit alcohol dehydrogenase family)
MNQHEIQQPLNGPIYDFRALGFTSGEVVVVTGGGSGIGRATALTAAKSALAVAVWDMDAKGAADTVRDIKAAGGTALAVTVNVGDDAEVARAWNESAGLGPCRYLVNNAGPASVSERPFDENLLLALGSMHRVTNGWMERHGEHAASVVNMSSVLGNYQGGTSSAFYPTAKAGISGYTRHLALKHGGRPRANAVAPGFIITPRTRPYLESEETRTRVARIPAGRMGYPEDVAAVVLFLLSPAAAYVNGALLPIDGGWGTS